MTQRCWIANVGRYAIPPNITLTVRREGDRLSVQEAVDGSEEPKQDLLPVSETEFFSGADDDWTFETDSQGHAAKMILHDAGKEIVAKRVA